jgi:phospholipid/cholesterol/gamma-HCH transport system substrate-binding protein
METRSNQVLVGSIVLALLAAVVIAAFWFSRLSDSQDTLYDIYFKQSVNGLAKGSGVSYAGVPSGQVKEIELWDRDPGFVRVRIAVKSDTPVLQDRKSVV